MTYTTIKRAYDIPCVHNIRPESTHIILACHGFGSNMDSRANTMLAEAAAREGIQLIACNGVEELNHKKKASCIPGRDKTSHRD